MEKIGKKKVLIITYYWPPSGGAGVQRWLKMAKYLDQLGTEVFIYTPENPEATIDHSLLKEIPKTITVIKRKIWEPYSLLKLIKGKNTNHSTYISNKKESFSTKIITWLRGNLLVPDPRCFWVKPSVSFLKNYILENQINNIITTGPPHSMHLIGLGLKKQIQNLNWIADFRDPWTFIDFFDHLKMMSSTKRKHHRLEKEVFQYASKVVTVSSSWAATYQKMYNRNVLEIQNGFDPADFSIENSAIETNTIRYFGSMNADRNPENLWKAFHLLLTNNENLKSDLKIEFYGMINPEIKESISKAGLDQNVTFYEYIPHQKVVELMTNSSILLLILNNTSNQDGIIPGKIFEYIGSNRPILCYGSTKGDSSKIIMESKSGQCFDENSTLETISTYILACLNGDYAPVKSDVSKYSRKTHAEKFYKLLH